jgi:predicted permease
MAEEVQHHLEVLTDELIRSGLSPEQATRKARMEFGGIDNVKDDCRQARGLALFDGIGRDIGYARRGLRKAKAFTATALATIAICIAANLSVFAVVDAVLLRPLPFPASEQLVRIFNTYPRAGVPDDGSSSTNYHERRGEIVAFSSLAAYRFGDAIVGEQGATERVDVTRVTPEFFPTLGVAPVLGRTFTEEEMTAQTNSVAVLTFAYWRERLGGDPRVIGRSIRIDELDKTVIGVLPAEFSFLSSRAKIYLPLASVPENYGPERRHSGSWAQMIGRLKPGVSGLDAQSQIDAHNGAMEVNGVEAKAMAEAGFRSLVVSLHDDHVASLGKTIALIQMGALLLLAIGAVNLANLLLIRASGRVKELALRRAIGASHVQIIRSAMVETLLLTVGGGVLGVALGAGGIQLLSVLGVDRLPLGSHIAFNASVALVALAASVVLGVAIGAPVAWQSLRGQASDALLSESRGSTASRGMQRLRHGFLVAQVALAFVLLAGAGLLGESLRQAEAITPGFRPESVLSGRLSLPNRSYPNRAHLLSFAERLIEDLSHQSGVIGAGIATNIPLSGNVSKSAAQIKGQVLASGESPRGIYSYAVIGDYFRAMGQPLIEGRFLDAADSRRNELVCVVDAAFARRSWPKGGALGQRLFQGGEQGSDDQAFTIVGVVGTVKQAGLTDLDDQGAVYYPFAYWNGDNKLFVVTRTELDAASFGGVLQGLVRRIDPELPVSDIKTMEDRLIDSLTARRSPALLASAFSVVAVLLTAIGIYGVLSYAVEQRRREISLRMALGADANRVRQQFLGLAMRLLAMGASVGLAGALLAGQAMRSVLFQVSAIHIPTLAATTAIVAVVALIACLLPAHRAASISPVEALADQ